MFGLNCASVKKSPVSATTAPKSAPIRRKKFVTLSKNSSAGKETGPSRFTYLNFGSGSTGRGKERFKRTPIFDYVPWSLLNR